MNGTPAPPTGTTDPPDRPAGRGARLAVLAGVAIVAGVAGWYFLVPEPIAKLQAAGAQILAQGGDVSEVALALENRGQKNEALLLRAESALKRGDLRQALAFIDGIPAAESDGRVACVVGEALLLSGQASPAGERFQFALKKDPDNKRALLGMAAAWYDLGALVRALEPAEKAAELDAKDGRALHLLGSIHLQLGERALGREKLELAAERELPTRQARDVVRQLLELELAEGRLEQAEGLAKRLAEFPKLTPHEKGLLAWLRELKADGETDKEGAYQELRSLASQDPENPRLPRWVGEMAMRLGKVSEAVDPLEKAARLEPQSLEPRHILALALERAGLGERAARVRADSIVLEGRLKRLTELNSQVDANPLDPKPRLEMSEICAQLGRPDWARQWVESAQRLGATGGTRPD